MLVSPQHSIHVSSSSSLHLHTLAPYTPIFVPFATTTKRLKISFCSAHNHEPNEDTDTPTPTTSYTQPILRRHNARSTALLLNHLSHQHEQKELEPEPEPVTEEDKIKLLELSLFKRRTPQFPGSIYLQSYSESSPTPLHRLFPKGEADIDNDKMLKQALEIRRKVTSEIFKECLRGGKFSINYSTNLIARLPDFIDHIMIETAAMKLMPEFAHSTFNARAKTYIRNSDVVPLIRWLKHNSMSYPQIAKLICMSCGNLKAIRQSVDWLKSIYVKGSALGPVLVKAGPGVLKRSEDELDEIVGYFERNGVRREWMGYVVSRCPKLLSYTMEEVRHRVKFYLDLGINEKDFGTMVFDSPKALGSFTIEEMTSKVNYLKEFGLSTEDVGRLLAFKPQLMSCSIEERWKPLVKYLYYLGVPRDGMKRILVLKPMVFCVDLETTVAPKVRFLQDIGMREDAIGGVLVKFPPLLTYSLYKKIRPVVIFLMTKAGVSEGNIGKVVALGPELLGCSIVHKLEINVKYFLSLGISVRILGHMIADFPMLLRYNSDILRPKYKYLRRTMVRPLHDLIEFPRFFSYSLDNRIIPRHKVVVENRINFKLRYMLACSDEEFDKRVAAAIEKRRMFESGEIDDHLSVSQETTFNSIDTTQASMHNDENDQLEP